MHRTTPATENPTCVTNRPTFIIATSSIRKPGSNLSDRDIEIGGPKATHLDLLFSPHAHPDAHLDRPHRRGFPADRPAPVGRRVCFGNGALYGMGDARRRTGAFADLSNALARRAQRQCAPRVDHGAR